MRSIALASAALLSLLVLAACGSAKHNAPVAEVASGEKVVLTQGTWAAYINYKQWLMPKSYTGPVGDGYFAVTTDGRGWGLTGCPDNSCDLGTLDKGAAIDECKNRNNGSPCLIFAHQDKVIVPYEIAH